MCISGGTHIALGNLTQPKLIDLNLGSIRNVALLNLWVWVEVVEFRDCNC